MSDNSTDTRRISWLLVSVALPFTYALSSGPVLATAFWLRQATRWEGFYAAIWLYAPLLLAGPDSLMWRYVGWWCDLFGTHGPG